MQICTLASGSKGNSIYISNGETAILIDAGLSGVEIERRLKSRNIPAASINAIVVSHEHADHIQGVGVLSRRYDLPVYMSPQTDAAASAQLGKIGDIRHFACGAAFTINTLTIRPFSTSHDACDPAGFTVGEGGKKIGIATDLGIATTMVKTHLKDCRCLVLEANHDLRMLEQGPYPWPLKQRIKGRTGHLSNESSRELFMELLHENLSHVILGHLSETNNTPELALRVVTEHLSDTRINITVAGQTSAGPIIHL